MKITFVSPPPNLSGGVRVIAIHAERLAKRGHEVTVVAPRRARTAKAGLRDLGRNLTRGRLTAGPVTSHYDQLEAARLVLLDHAGPVTEADVPDGDIVVATWWETAFSVAAFPASKGRKVYFIQHHEVHHAGRRHIAAGSYHLPLKKITISNWLVEAMR
ncbi:MAG: glycosyltransferase family 1 protein, partial [Pseudomonadota bacterium]